MHFPLPATFATSRAALQSVAEHILSAERYQRMARIGLSASPGGFTNGELRVEGIELVAPNGRWPLTTLGALARAARVTPGAPRSVYSPTTPLDLDAPITVDPESARIIAEWFALADAALRALSVDLTDATEPTLWPEHFDLAISAENINFGASPGDGHNPAPYLYVGPWEGRPAECDPFWNEQFGASLSYEQAASASDALAFWREGLVRVREVRATS